MNKRIVIWLLALVFTAQTASAQTCSACFTATPDSINPYLITLDASCSAASPNALYDWSIDGILISSFNYPYFQMPFNSSGTHTILLEINDGVCSDSISQTITLSPSCLANFQSIPVGGSSFHFAHLGGYSPSATYTWDFGDGSAGNGQYVFHNFTATGTYNVCLTFTDSVNPGCTDTYCETVTAVYTGSTSSCIASFTTTLDSFLGVLTADASGSNYDPATTNFDWYLDGVLYQTGPFPSFSTVLVQPGTYTLSLVLSDANNNPCDTSSQLITFGGIGANGCNACFNTYYSTNYDSVYLTNCSVIPSGGSSYWLINGNVVNNTSSTFLQGFPIPGYQSITVYVLDSTNAICDSMNQIIYTYSTPCNSCLSITPVAGSTSDYVFDGSCSSNMYAYNWSVNGIMVFTSYTPQFTYSFNQSGIYSVCLNTMDSLGNYCSSACSNVTVNTPTSTQFDLAGRIYKTDAQWNYTPAGSGEATVYLIKLVTGGTLNAIDSTTTDAGGMYYFPNKPIDDYRIKVALNPSSPDYANNIPCYYIAGLMWYDAQVITLFGNTYNRDVFMPFGVNPGGNGFISGNVFQGANKGGKTRSGNENVTLILMDQANNSPIAYAKPDANGNYSFSNIPNGNYRVYGELLNRASIPETIVISSTQNSYSNKNFVYNNNVIQPTNQTVSTTNVEMVNVVSLAPNPTKGITTLRNNERNQSIRIYDMTGRLMQELILKPYEQKNIDGSAWPKGLYMVEAGDGRSKTTMKLLMQ